MMKKNSIMFMLLLITSTIIFACSNDEDLAFPEEDNKVGKLTSSSQEEDDIQDFFSKSLPAFGSGDAPLFAFDSERENFCICLNSKEELQGIYLGEEAIPFIDFENLTLIIGKVSVPDSSCELDSHEVVLFERHAELNMTVKRGTNAYPAFFDLYFWALYPKFDREITNVNLTVK